jgi:Uma2 family endonuclease
MASKTLLSIAEYAALDEPAGVRYELSEGELIVSPSPNYTHNQIRDEFNSRLRVFVKEKKLGGVVSEMDFQLGEDTVRRPDIAFISAAHLESIDLARVPLAIAPDLAIEIVSPSDRAADLLLKVAQYLAAGTKAVWLFYPNTRLAYRYLPGRLEPEVRSADAGHSFEDRELLPGFQLTLAQIFE